MRCGAGRVGPHGGASAREMPCEACGIQFSVFRRKRACSECLRLYCAGCLRRGGGMCAPCRALCTRPLQRAAIAHLKPRDLQCFLHRQNVSTRGCVEKEDLLSLCVCHVNSAAYRRRGSAANGAGSNSPFTLKGLTTNINDFLNNTFNVQPAPPPNTHSNARPPPASSQPPPPSATRERFTTNPGGERDFRVPPPPAPASDPGSMGRSASTARVDTADCFEVEDVDDAGWEFVARPPADPLPNDSDVLMSTPEWSPPALELSPPRAAPAPTPSDGTPQRAASVLDLRAPPSAHHDLADTASMHDEPRGDAGPHTLHRESADTDVSALSLDALSPSGLEALSVRQLKELLARNRVEFRSCLERGELLQRARALLLDHQSRRAELDALPLDECCKICMAAPLECVLLECGHIAACTACAKQLHECPICRRYVVRAVRCFRS